MKRGGRHEGHKRFEAKGEGGSITLRLFASLLLMVALGLATFGVGYATEIADDSTVVTEDDGISENDSDTFVAEQANKAEAEKAANNDKHAIPESDVTTPENMDTNNKDSGTSNEDKGTPEDKSVVPNDTTTDEETLNEPEAYVAEIDEDLAAEAIAQSAQPDDSLINQYPELAAKILDQIVNRKTDVLDVSSYNISSDDLDNLLDEILLQHPELFDVGTSWNGPWTTPTQTFQARYLFTDKSLADILAMRQKMARGIAHAMSWIPANGTDLQKAKAAQDFLVAHVTYDSATYTSNPSGNWSGATDLTTYGAVLTAHDPFYPYCAYGPLVEHSGVCQGISYAFKLLMDQCGIPCEYVSNPVDHHGWNHVQIDGEWYNVDATWDLDNWYEYGNYTQKIFSGVNENWHFF